MYIEIYYLFHQKIAHVNNLCVSYGVKYAQLDFIRVLAVLYWIEH